MSEEWALTSYCGLYCRDCIPSKKDLYATVVKLAEMLPDVQFEKYAEMKANQTNWSKTNEAFKYYPRFMDVLQAIRGLECPATCREGGGYKQGDCAVRKCAVDKKIAGCWECPEHTNCKLLEPLFKIHPNLPYHLDLIKLEGVENWAKHRRGHYYWQ